MPRAWALILVLLSISVASAQTVAERYGKLPLGFEVNRGQSDSRVKFLSRGRGYTLFLTSNEAVLANADRMTRMKLVGANKKQRVSGEDPLPGHSNYFIGNDPRKWHTDVPTYAKVHYREVYSGVDLVYHSNQRQLEYDFVISPGADPHAIQFAFAGADAVALDASGDLIVDQIRLHKPIAYQEREGKRKPVNAKFIISRKGRVSFEVAEYDRSRPLIIDPLLVYSTYLGGSSDDEAEGIAVGADGSAYITGRTISTNFPTTAGTFQPAGGGSSDDAFVTKLNAAGSALVYSTYLGGSDFDRGSAISVDGAGNAYVTGRADSTDFPTTSGAFDTTHNGAMDVFVTKVNAAGNGLVYSTFLGGSGDEPDFFSGLTIDGFGNAYITGQTCSSDFPTTLGAFDRTFGGFCDAFVSKLNPSGSALVYSTYLGGSDFDFGTDIAVDAAGNAYVTGGTSSANFPTTLGAFDMTLGGGEDVFVTKLNAAGSALVYSTFLGGSGDDEGRAIDLDSSGNAYLTGNTDSTDFPTTPNAFAKTIAPSALPENMFDAFVTKLNPSGSALVYSTYLGGSGFERALGMAVDPTAHAYVTGFTISADFPTTPGAFDTTLSGAADAFLTKLNADGSALTYSTYLGGGGSDAANAITVDFSANAYVTGFTDSTDFPTTPLALDTTFNGGNFDAFVAKISSTPQDQFTDLIGTVGEIPNLPQGNANSLTAKLQNASAHAAAGNTTAACNELNAFINEVRAQSGTQPGKKLTPAQGDQLIAAARAIQAALGCP